MRLFDTTPPVYEEIALDTDGHTVALYHNVPEFRLSETTFEQLWNHHPPEFHEVRMHGRWVKTPRWQQAYGRNYTYTGSRNNALPLPPPFEKYLEWSRQHVDKRLNGLLLNWYDGTAKHYIGKHRDSTTGLLDGTPIVTISHGEERIFRMRPYGGSGFRDFPVRAGDVVVVPWETNQTFTHEVPHFARYGGRRISVTLRAFAD